MPKARKGRLAPSTPGELLPRMAHPAAAATGSPRRLWMWRGLLALGVPLGLLLMVEIVLRLVGVGVSPCFFEVHDSGAWVIPKLEYGRSFMAQARVTRPFVCQMANPKPPGSLRIFLLGESAAMGTPDPAFGMARILELMLRQQHPGRPIEVINAAMRGVDSYVVRRVAFDCARYEPDLLVVYAGNNEAIGLHSPTPDTPDWIMNRPLNLLADAGKATRLGQVLRGAMGERNAAQAQTMESLRAMQLPAGDPRRDHGRANFAANLADILRVGGPALPKVLATVAVNLHDCPPLGSQFRPGLEESQRASWETLYARGVKALQTGDYAAARHEFTAAAALDDQPARLHFRLAQTWEALGSNQLAAVHYQRAVDLDTLPFRATSGLNQAIRRAASDFAARGVVLCDAERALAASPDSPSGVPGARLFYEHVHPTFLGTWWLAASVYPSVTQALARVLEPASGPGLPTAQACAQALAFTRVDEYNVQQAVVKMTAGPPFLDQEDHAWRQAAAEQSLSALGGSLTEHSIQEALATYAEAIRRQPEDWPLRFNLANLYLQLKQPQLAVAPMEWVAQHFPWVGAFHLNLHTALVGSGRQEEGRACLERAAKSAARDPQWREATAQKKGRRQRT